MINGYQVIVIDSIKELFKLEKDRMKHPKKYQNIKIFIGKKLKNERRN